MTKGQRYYAKNREAICAKAREKYQENAEQRREQSRQSMKRHRTANPRRNAELCAVKYAKNRDQICEGRRAARAANPALRRAEKDRNLRRWYGITIETYDEMHAAQGGLCGICGKTETALTGRFLSPALLAVDHEKESGKVRGLLCSRCNRAIGLLGHREESLLAAVAYLKRSR